MQVCRVANVVSSAQSHDAEMQTPQQLTESQLVVEDADGWPPAAAAFAAAAVAFVAAATAATARSAADMAAEGAAPPPAAAAAAAWPTQATGMR